VGENWRLDSARPSGARSAHPTIALLIASTVDPASQAAWAGVESAARDRGANLLCVVGGALHSPDAAAAQANILYDLVSAETVDGLLIWAEGLARFVDTTEVREFCQRYHPLPVIVAASPVEGCSSIVVDGYAGMREAVAHLVQVHHRQRVAFVRGPEDHRGAQDCYRAYVDVLKTSGLALDPALVVAGDLQVASGRRATEELLDRRRLAAGADFDALVAADDAAAVEAIEALQERGIRVPQDVAVVAFGNTQAGNYVTPPLTTVPSLIYEQARQATDMLLALMAGQQVPERVTLPTRLLVRQSCGCPDPLVVQAAAEPTMVRGESFESILTAQRADILAVMTQAVEGPLAVGAFVAGLNPRWAEHILAAFAVEVSGEAPGVFLSNLSRMLRPLARAGNDVAAWQGVISALRRQVLPYLLRDRETLTRAENLFQQARILIGRVAEQAGAYRLLQAEQQSRAWHKIEQALGAVSDLDDLTEVLARDLPALGIRRCYLSLYEDVEAPGDWSNLVLAYDEGGRVEVAPDKRRFPTSRLAPEGLVRTQGRYNMTLDPVHLRQGQLGFVLLELDSRQAAIHAPLSLQLSNALQWVLPTPSAEGQALQLRTGAETSRAAGSILESDGLTMLSRVSQALAAAPLQPEAIAEMITRQFYEVMGAQKASVCLFDAQAGGMRVVADYAAGERGLDREGQGAGHSLPDYRATARMLETREPLVVQASDTSADPAELTYMAQKGLDTLAVIPLAVRGESIGVIELESWAGERHYTPEELELAMILANQVAVALQNARLFEQEQQASRKLGQRVQELDILNDIGHKIDEAPPLPDFLRWAAGRIPLAMQRPEVCVAAIEFNGEVYGLAEAVDLPRQVVQGLYVGGERVGRVYVAYTEECDFANVESALLGDISRRLGGYIENQRLLQQTQQQLADLDIIQSTMSQLAAALTFDDALDLLLPQVAGLTQAETVAMYLVDKGYMIRSGVYSVVERDDLTIGQVDRLEDYPLTQKVLEIGQPLAVMTDDPRLQPQARRAFEAAGVTASATIPLVGREGLVGFLTLHRYQAGPGFSEHEVMLVQTLADQATTTIEKSRLLERIRHRTVQLETAAQISQAASSILSVDDLIAETVNLIRDQFEFYYVGLFLVDQDSGFAVLRAGTGEAGWAMVEGGHKLAIGGESMIGRCIAEKQPGIALDVGEEAVRFDNPLLPGTHSELALPLIARGQVRGALTVQSDKVTAFSGADITVLQTMADQLANALANAQLYTQAQESARRSQALYETSRALSAQLDEEAQLRTIMEAIYRTLDCEVVAISTVDEGTRTISIRHLLWKGQFDTGPEWIARSSFPLDHPNILADICRSGRTEIISGWDERFDRQIWEQLGQDRFLRVFMPLQVGDQNLGVVVVSYDRSVKQTVGDDEVQLLAALVGQAAVALRQARLFAEEKRARALLGVRVKELDVLNDIGRQIDQAPSLAELLPWVAERIPAAMQFPDLCTAAIRFGDQVYGARAALESPFQMVRTLDIGAEQIGRVYVAYSEERDFLDEESALLGEIARRLSGYIQNQRLLRDTQTRAEELAVLAELGQSLAASLSVDDVLQAAYRQASRLVDTSDFYIGLYEPEKEQVRFALSVSGSEIDHGLSVVPASQGLTGYIIQNRASVLLEENVLEGMKEIGVEVLGDPGSQSWLGVPLLVGDQVLGAMAVQSFTTPRLYDQHDLELMTAIANQTAVALQNAHLYQEMQIRAEEQATLRRITEAINQSLDMEEMLDSALETLLAAMRFDAALISMTEPGSQRLSLVAERGLPPAMAQTLERDGLEGTLCAHVFRTREMICIADVRQGAPVDVAGLIRLGLFTYMGTPLVYQDENLGTICCFNRTVREMTDRDMALLKAIGAQMAVGMANVRLYQETQAALAEVESAHRSYLRRAWEDHLRQRAVLQSGLLYDQTRAERPEDARMVPELWLPEMERALEEGRAVTVADEDGEGGRAGLAIPITLRGETIGILGVEAPTADHHWTDEDLALVQAVSEQLGQTLESARLFADTQRRAERERLVAEITGKIRASTEVRDILETAAVELGQALGTSRALIRLSPVEAANGRAPAPGDANGNRGPSAAGEEMG